MKPYSSDDAIQLSELAHQPSKNGVHVQFVQPFLLGKIRSKQEPNIARASTIRTRRAHVLTLWLSLFKWDPYCKSTKPRHGGLFATKRAYHYHIARKSSRNDVDLSLTKVVNPNPFPRGRTGRKPFAPQGGGNRRGVSPGSQHQRQLGTIVVQLSLTGTCACISWRVRENSV